MRSFLVRHWFLFFLVFCVGSALVFPNLIHPLIDHFEPRSTVAISLFLVAWTMPTRSLFAEFRQPWASAWAVVISYGLVPISAWLFGYFAPKDVQIGLVLVASVPCTLASAILWTRMAGGNEATALLTVMGTTFLSWLLTTAWLYLLTSTSVAFDVPAMMVNLIFTLVLPVVLGQLMRRVPVGRSIAEKYKLWIAIVAQCLVLAIVLKAGTQVGDKLQEPNALETPAILAWSVTLAIGLHLWAILSGWVSCAWLRFDRGRQIAVAFSASQKTLQVSLILFDQFKEFPFAIMPILFYHVGQLLVDTAIARRIFAGEPSEVADDLAASG